MINTKMKLEIFREAAEPIIDLIENKEITEIYIDSWDNISYMIKGLIVDAENKFEGKYAFSQFCSQMTNDISQDNKFVSTNSPEGHRFSIYVPEKTLEMDEWRMTIRLFRAAQMTYKDLIERGAFDQNTWDLIYQYVVNNKNILISGKPNSGKTTLLRCLLHEVIESKNPRIGILEDPAELNLEFNRGFVIEVDHRDPDSVSEALRHCLRNSPQIMVHGEILDPAVARTFLEAIEAGFSGMMSTIHADNAKVATSRLATLATKSSNVSRKDWQSTADNSIDLIVHVDFNTTSGVRRVSQVYDVKNEELLFDADKESD